MSLSFQKRFRTPSEIVEEVLDIDITPVMNMFIILIPFLVSMAVFTHHAIVDFNLPSNAISASNDNSGELKLKITVVAAENHLLVTLGEKVLDSIPTVEKEYDLQTLTEKLKSHREEHNVQDDVVVAVKDNVKFKRVVNIMDQCKNAGFDRVGLSTAESGD